MEPNERNRKRFVENVYFFLNVVLLIIIYDPPTVNLYSHFSRTVRDFEFDTPDICFRYVSLTSREL